MLPVTDPEAPNSGGFTAKKIAFAAVGVAAVTVAVLSVWTALQKPTPSTWDATSTPSRSAVSVVDSVLLTPEELSQHLRGVKVIATPTGAGDSVLALTATIDGPTEVSPSTEVFPPVCSNVVFTGDHIVFGNGPVEHMKTETFSQSRASLDTEGNRTGSPELASQTVAVFPTAADAQNVFDTQRRQWQVCRTTTGAADQFWPEINVRVINPPSGTSAGVQEFIVGAIDEKKVAGGDRIAVSMAANGGIYQSDACQQAMGVHGNVIVEARTCQAPRLPDPGSPVGDAQFPVMQEANPSWAIPDAQRLVEGMLNKIS